MPLARNATNSHSAAHGPLAQQVRQHFGPRSLVAKQSWAALGKVLVGLQGESLYSRWHAAAERLCGQHLSTVATKASKLGRSTLGVAATDRPLDALLVLQLYYGLVVAAVAEVFVPGTAGVLDLPQSLASADDRAGLSPRSAVAAMLHATATKCLTRPKSPPGDPRHPGLGDVFKPLYEELFPRPLRHAMGEYYTPDWLAERLLDGVGHCGDPNQRLLDPACGSGTFLVRAIDRVLRHHAMGNTPRLAPEDLVATITRNICGIELGPLAALSARANYLIALGGLLEDGQPLPRPPIFECDSILDVPSSEAFSAPFDVVVGNPPWIAWDNLPADYREATRSLWERYGLFSLSGTAARHGGGKKDLAMLMLYATADRYLKPGGRLGMVLTQTLLQTKGAGDGFRRFQLGRDGLPLRVLRADDYVAARPFADAANWTCTLVIEKGRPTEYPVPYVKWSAAKRPSDRENVAPVVGIDAPHLIRREYKAHPIDAGNRASPWFLQPAAIERNLRLLVGRSDYRAYLGANSGGANGVFWVSVLGRDEDGVRIRPTLASDDAEYVIEPDLLYPLLRWGDLDRFTARPQLAILLAQDPQRRTGWDAAVFTQRWPKTLSYLRAFEPLLRRRAAYRRYQSAGPFYSMYNVGPYTLAMPKVVWRRMDTRLRAAVVDTLDHPVLGVRPIIPQETCVLIPCRHDDEAHYLAALMNSTPLGFLVASHSVAGGKGFGTPSILDYLNVRRFDPENPHHATLAALSREAHAGSGDPAALARALDTAAAELYDLSQADLAAIWSEGSGEWAVASGQWLVVSGQ